MRRLAVALLCCGAAALAAGCGERKERVAPGHPQQVQLMLDFFPNADHAGIYAAQANGRFRQVGLNVKIRTPSDPAAPLRQAAAGRTTLAISYEPEVLRARDRGLKVVSVGALVQKPLTSIISLPPARIGRPADLAGKRVGTAGIDYQHAFLQAILKQAGADPGSVKEQNVGFNLVPALLSGKVDAILGGYFNYEGVDLRQRKKHPRIIPVNRAGVPTYDELVFVTSEEGAKRNAGVIRSFLAAVARGTRDLARHPRNLSALLRDNPDLDAKLQRASVKVLLQQHLFDPPKGRPFGYQDPNDWNAFAAFMQRAGLISASTARGAFTNALLPGQGP
ncbi:MAG: ABC transporter substrate-binding protein [Actinobacteria bacterium]|nr:ABC transporter substrate-binding protein [Actinomycetota bacterium]